MELEECSKQFRARPLPGTRRRTQIPTPQQHRVPARQLTTPSPFRLHTNTRSGFSGSTIQSRDEVELSKKFRALPLPNNASSGCMFGNDDRPFHLRSQQQYEISKERKDKLVEEEVERCKLESSSFKAKPAPKTTYVPLPDEKPSQTRPLTVPKPPRLSSIYRAEERMLYDQHAEELRRAEDVRKKMEEQQQKELEEEEIKRQRRLGSDEGGFCFRSKDAPMV